MQANRFLRGMVRALVATMLKVGRDKITVDEFKSIFKNADNSHVEFSAPSHALVLNSIKYPQDLFI